MQGDYQPFIDRVIHRYEGGYGWNRKDPGGPTKYGITCYDLAEHRGQKMNSMSAWAPLVQAMPLAEAEAIYRTKYAVAIRFDELPAGVDCCMLDYGINSGIARPIHVARALLGIGPGNMSQVLVDRLKTVDPKWFVGQMNAERLRFMHAIRGGEAWIEFGRGWQARVDDLTPYADHLIAGSPAPAAPDLTHVITPKAKHVAKKAGTMTAGSTVTAAGTAHAAGAPWYATGAIAVAMILAGMAYEVYQETRAAKLNATPVGV